MEGPSRQRVQTSLQRPWETLTTTVPSSSILTSIPPLPVEAKKGQASPPTPSFRLFLDDEDHSTAIQNDTFVNEEGIASEDVEAFHEFVLEKSYLEYEDLDSDDPFDQVNMKLSVSGSGSISPGESSGDGSLRSIQGVMDELELVMVKDLSEVSSNPATQWQLDHLLDQLITSGHPKVTVEVKVALVEFKRKAYESFQEFQATVESVNKLKNFEKHLARIQQETDAGKGRWKDLKNSIRKASLALNAENSRKEELEAEIATLRKQLATKERDLEQLVLKLKNQEATLSAYSTSFASLHEQARALSKEADDLLAASSGIKHEGEAAEMNQNRLKSTWSSDLISQFIKIRKMILGRYD
ncbi:disease resistance protein [Sesbania bispinosa]|nr:disease resistance protein [Sesbania bispinosa]